MLAAACSAVKPIPVFRILEQAVHGFPKVSERYDGDVRDIRAVSEAVFLAQLASATVTRSFTSHGSRSQLARGQCSVDWTRWPTHQRRVSESRAASFRMLASAFPAIGDWVWMKIFFAVWNEASAS